MQRKSFLARLVQIVVGTFVLLLFGLLLFANVKKWYDRRGQERSVSALEEEIARLKNDQQMNERRLLDLQSPFFIEKEGREKFGARKQGELVVVFPALRDDETETGAKEKKASPPFFQQWFQYFFSTPK